MKSKITETSQLTKSSVHIYIVYNQSIKNSYYKKTKQNGRA